MFLGESMLGVPALLIGAWLVYHVVKHWKFYCHSVRIPGYVTIPIVGDLIMLAYHKLDVMKLFNLLNKQHEGCFRVCGRKMIVFLQKPEYLEVLFTHPGLQDKGQAYDGLSELLGDKSLFVVNSEESRASKKVFVKTFNNSSQELVIENLYKTANEFIDELHGLSGDSWFQVGDRIKNATAVSFFRTILDIELKDYPCLEKGVADFELYAFLVVARGASPLHRIDFIFDTFLGGKKMRTFIKDFDGSIQQIIDKKKAALEDLERRNKAIPNQFIYNITGERKDDSHELLRTDIKTIIAAALDTSFLATSFTLLLLGMHPDIQEKVYEEDEIIQEELGGKPMVESDFSKYKYLSRVQKETMRLYPPVPLAPREAREDIKIGKYTIPKGTSVIGANLTVHRDPEIYENPLRFDPDRFLDENVKKRHKYAYCPFSAGQRSCPGFRYGTQSVIFFVSTVVRNFHIETKYNSISEIDENLEYTLSLYDKRGFQIRLQRR